MTSTSTDSDARVADAIRTCMGALSALSNRERALTLRAIGGMNNLIVQAPAQIANRVSGQESRAQSARASNNGRASSTPNPANKDPKVLKIKAALKENAAKIKKECLALKAEMLPAEHALIKERETLNVSMRCFRDSVTNLKPEETSGKSSTSEGLPLRGSVSPIGSSGGDKVASGSAPFNGDEPEKSGASTGSKSQ